MPTESKDDVLVDLRGIEKEFAGNKALKGVSLSFRSGEVHGLLGENGAGKSTLIKILTGVYSHSAGQILVEGRPVHIHNPLDARRLGLGAVYQDAELVGSFTVGQNILLGNEPGRGLISNREIHRLAKASLDEIGIAIDVQRLASTLSAAEMQLVTLATLFHRRYKLIVLDEPTARLSATESELLFDIIQRFRSQGIAIVYISHRLNEIRRICDRASILRGGLLSATLEREEITEDRVTQLMVDRSRSDLETYNEGHSREEVVLRVADLATDHLEPPSFAVPAGEVLGITGPVGGGMEQVERALGGIAPHKGRVELKGRQVSLAGPPAARRAGVALIPEDRRKQALFPNLSIADNICLPVLHTLRRLGMINQAKKLAYAQGVMERLSVRPKLPRNMVKFFSGGNQQKAVIGKWLSTQASLYIFVEPTSGVDVGAIKEIYDVILHLAGEGAAVIVISSSIKEILALAERVMVIHDGQLVHDAPKRDCTHDQLLALAMQGRSRKAA